MTILELAKHPEALDHKTLYKLRQTVAEYPYFQLARLLMLRNMYLLHDPAFDEELQRASIFLTDRRVLFNLVEAVHYQQKRQQPQEFSIEKEDYIKEVAEPNQAETDTQSRTVTLIDTFLSTIPDEEKEKNSTSTTTEHKGIHRPPTAADATVDYVAYLLSTDFEELDNKGEDTQPIAQANENKAEEKEMNGCSLIDAFINNDGGRITLKEEPEYLPEIDEPAEGEPQEDCLTETLAGIYIKQGRYEKALSIMNRINDSAAKNNPYFADQQRFLKKLIKLSNSQKTKQ